MKEKKVDIKDVGVKNDRPDGRAFCGSVVYALCPGGTTAVF